MVHWNGSAAADVYAYQVQWGPFSPINPLGFEPKNQALVTVGDELRYRIGALLLQRQPVRRQCDGARYQRQRQRTDAAVYATPVAGGNPVPLAPTALSPAGRTATSAGFVWQPGAGPAPAGYRLYYTGLAPSPRRRRRTWAP